MIAVVGDIMVDQYIYGSSTRMSPECLTAPVIKEYSKETYVGGAGNTALNIKYLGGVAKLYCAVAINSVLLSMLDDAGYMVISVGLIRLKNNIIPTS